MRIGLNATCFNDRPSGASQRFRQLYGALIRRCPEIEFVVFEPLDCRVAAWFGGTANVVARRTPLPSAGRTQRLWAGLGYWPAALAAERLDLFEAFSLPLVRARCPSLLTIHDLRPVARDRPLPARLAAARVVRHALAGADRIITVSRSMSEEIRAFRPDTAVSVVANGIDVASFALRPGAGEVAAVRARRSLPERFILTVGHLEARKNHAVLLDAVARLRDAGRLRPLAIVGNDGGARADLVARIDALGLGALVTLVEGADDAEVRALHAACAQVVVPSRYEGFGIGLIEAMAAERPLVTSDLPVFRELTEGQGCYFGVDDPIAAASAIERVWADPAEAERLVDYGRSRVRAFDIDTLAEQLADVHRAVLSAAR